MSSRNAEETGPPRASWSLTARLTCHYAAATALLLGAAAGLLDWTLERGLDARDRAQATSKVRVLRTLLREHHAQPEVIASEIEHEAAESQPVRYYLRILDANGRIRIETTGMAAALPPEVFGAPADPTPDGEASLRSHGSHLLATAGAETGAEGGERRTIQVALDLSSHRALTAEYRRMLAAVLIAGIALAAAAGRWIARRGLRSLAEMTETTRRITARRLHERVSARRWPAELTALAAAQDGMLDRLEDAFGRLSNLTGDMAHALRNPINVLRGEAEVALGRARTPAEYQQVLASSLEELERLSRMIDGLLFIARAEDARLALERTVFRARAEMDAVKDFYEALAAEAGIAVECAGDATLDADPMLVRRAISNLLANALKHTLAGGTVRVTAREVAGGGAEIEVRDNGRGIPAELLPRVFERFFQADASRDLTAKGSGLGLAIVQSILRLHGGTAALESEAGQGTTVTLRFPGSVTRLG